MKTIVLAVLSLLMALCHVEASQTLTSTSSNAVFYAPPPGSDLTEFRDAMIISQIRNQWTGVSISNFSFVGSVEVSLDISKIISISFTESPKGGSMLIATRFVSDKPFYLDSVTFDHNSSTDPYGAFNYKAEGAVTEFGQQVWAVTYNLDGTKTAHTSGSSVDVPVNDVTVVGMESLDAVGTGTFEQMLAQTTDAWGAFNFMVITGIKGRTVEGESLEMFSPAHIYVDIPEPNTVTLMATVAVGALLFARFRRYKRKHFTG